MTFRRKSMCIFIHFKKLVQCYVSYWKTKLHLWFKRSFTFIWKRLGMFYNYCQLVGYFTLLLKPLLKQFKPKFTWTHSLLQMATKNLCFTHFSPFEIILVNLGVVFTVNIISTGGNGVNLKGPVYSNCFIIQTCGLRSLWPNSFRW